MDTIVIQKLQNHFDGLSHTLPDDGIEFWFARELMEPLGYARWENFVTAIHRAVDSCKTSGYSDSDHFRGVTKMVTLGSGAERAVDDFMLTRYACYLIAQNGDPRKEAIAFAQSYFAVQTRKQELIEDRMRLYARLDARERLPNICEIGKERIRRAGAKIVASGQFSVVREEMEKYGCVKLSRPHCLAKSDEPNSRGVSTGSALTERGALFSIGSNSESGSVDSIKHCGRPGEKLKQGIHLLSDNSAGVTSGAGNATSNLREGWLPCKYGHFGSEPAITGNRQDAECPHFKTENCPLKTDNYPDTGFRVLKVDSSNMADVYSTPDTLNQSMLDAMTDNIKLGRTPEDLLFQVLLDWGVDLTLPIRKETVQSKTIFFVDENALIACFDAGITEELVKELATHKPLRVVFRDNGFASDAVKINVTQIFKQMAPGTEVKTL